MTTGADVSARPGRVGTATGAEGDGWPATTPGVITRSLMIRSPLTGDGPETDRPETILGDGADG